MSLRRVVRRWLHWWRRSTRVVRGDRRRRPSAAPGCAPPTINTQRPPLLAIGKGETATTLLEVAKTLPGKSFLLLIRRNDLDEDSNLVVPQQLAHKQVGFVKIDVDKPVDQKTELWVDAGYKELFWGPTYWFGDDEDADALVYTNTVVKDTEAPGVHVLISDKARVEGIATNCLTIQNDFDSSKATPAERWCSITEGDVDEWRKTAMEVWEIPEPETVRTRIDTKPPEGDIEGEIANLRVVYFSTAGIGFILSMNPSALAGAPHTHIATVYAEEAAEGRILRDLATAFPNITAIRVRDAIDRVTEVLGGIAAAITYGALATLVTGGIVLIGAAAAGERGRTYEAAILKTLGASRRAILLNFALRSALLGAAAGVVAIAAGGLAGWGVTRFVMETDFRFEVVSATAIVIGGILATLLAGLAFAWRPLASRPARVLRQRE